MKRRQFLKATAVALAAGGCTPAKKHVTLPLPEPNQFQLDKKYKDRSAVLIAKASSYNENLFDLVKPHLDHFYLGRQDAYSGKRIIIKPNIVEYRDNNLVHTNKEVLRAAIQFAQHLGAKEITVAEGPGHMRDTEFLLEATGIGPMLKKLSIPFIDLNLDDIEAVDNEHGFNGLKKFYLPKTIVDADFLISVPKMKTHHWVGVTISMKNLFGCVPGRKYGWPKNLLHHRGISHCILDLVHMIKPSFALVDGIEAMEGDGPINGTLKKAGVLVLGSDFAAVDSTCARIMKIDPTLLPYIQMSGRVVGNTDPSMIDIIGESVESVCQEFEKPPTLKDESLLALSSQQGS